MRRTLLIILCLFFIYSENAFSQNVKFILGGGISFGGDEVYELKFTDGGSSKGVAGQGGFFDVGVQYVVPNLPKLFFRGTVGYKFLLNPTENANTKITRIPLTVLANWKVQNKIRIGLGITTHTNTKVDGDGFVDDRDLKSSVGPRFEIAYKQFALTYTILNYTDKATDEVFSANAFGLSISGTIPLTKKKSVESN